MIRALFDRQSPAIRALLPGLLLSAIGAFAFAAVLDQFLERDDLYIVDQPVLEGLARVRTAVAHDRAHVDHQCLRPWDSADPRWPRVSRLVAGDKAVRNPALLVGAMATSTVVAFVVKMIVHRPRPPESLQVIPGLETSFSFPSGHTAGAATLVLIPRVPAVAGRAGVGASSRWPSDRR